MRLYSAPYCSFQTCVMHLCGLGPCFAKRPSPQPGRAGPFARAKKCAGNIAPTKTVLKICFTFAVAQAASCRL